MTAFPFFFISCYPVANGLEKIMFTVYFNLTTVKNGEFGELSFGVK